MADELDVAALENGSNDLAGSDLRSLHLEARNFSARDFSGALLEQTVITNSDLSNCKLTDARTSGLQIVDSDLNGIVAITTAFFMTSFRGSSLIKADFNGSHFVKADFTNCDLKEANFSRCHISEDCVFSNAVSDETTNFDGVHILRPLARQPVFRFYEVVKGVLQRRKLDGSEIAQADTVKIDELAQSAKAISIRRREIAPVATAIAMLAEQRLAELAAQKPNSPEALIDYEKEVEVLERVRTGFSDLSVSVLEEDTTIPAKIAQSLGSHLVDVVKTHGRAVIGAAVTLSCLCGGAALLSLCGIPMPLGVITTAGLLSGRTAAEAVAHLKSK